MTDVIVRIILRYVAGALVIKGIIPDDLGNTLMTDPQVIDFLNIGLGLTIGAITEGWYILARRFGWAK